MSTPGPGRLALHLMHLLQQWKCVVVYPRLVSSGRRYCSGIVGEREAWSQFLAAAVEQKKQESQELSTSKAAEYETPGANFTTNAICRSTPAERDAVLLALRTYLCEHKDVAPADAEDIVKDAPAFSRKLVAAVKAKLTRSRAGYYGRLDEDKCREYAEDVIFQEEVNVVEAFLESLGVDPRNWSELTPVVTMDLAGLIASVKVLQDVGLQRRQMGRLLERDKHLLCSSAADLQAAIQSLEDLGFSRAEIADICFRLPVLLRVGLENVVAAVAQEDEDAATSVEGCDSSEMDGLSMLRKNVRYLKRDLGFSDKQVIKLVQGYSKASRVWTADLAEVTRDNIGVLKDLGLTNENIRRVLSYTPAVINLTKESILEKIAYLRNLGVSRIGSVITRYPAVLQYNIGGNVEMKINYLKSLGVDPASMGKVLTQCPSVLGYSLDAKLKPTIAFLEGIGLRGEKLAKLIVTKPPVLAYSVEGSYADTKEFLMKLGLEPGTKAMARAFAASFSCSVITMQARFEFFVERGFPREWVRDMLRTQPSLLCLSEQNLVSKLSFFEGVLDLHEMPSTKVAIYLSFGLDSRVKPRFRLLSWLKEQGHLPADYPFQRILDLSESRFYGKFVEPYPAAAAVFRDNPITGDEEINKTST